ncbi:prostamide/prostaglandin F synthase [Lingula anatina]|uniref:Prostamide/prostaglandin F synthase n=1 Tax=Lingula anatina TaxID=7574 RepID=A0A1S3HKN5_LINAN|nr:prostamide/prostaglandin F synthase [Lingula anatina]XP_013386664.1 prostamide/prostaglandin F synthase [Lingula anatina]|eukprot:XP_013386663.1 prostamide/prostaglandin F synthase [Lingula anatina]
MVAVGLEEVGVEDYMKGNYFSGEVYIDQKQQCYKDMGYKRYGILSGLMSILKKVSRAAMAKAKEQNITGDFKGDGFQNGGTIIVSAGGSECLLNWRQENPGEHVPLEDVLKALGIDGGAPATEQKAEAPKVVCEDDVCYKK